MTNIARSVAKVLRNIGKTKGGNVGSNDRASRAFLAKSELGEDFFGGWVESDSEIFSRYARPASPMPGKITDFLGIVTDNALHPWATHLFGTSVTAIPIPDDGLRAEAIEYFAVLRSVETAPADSFAMVELGASYAPWLTAAAVVALRTGRRKLNLVAVEASRLHFDLIEPHFAENGIVISEHSVKLFHGAVSTRQGLLRFPVARSAADNGGQAVSDGETGTFVAKDAVYEEVRAYTLAEVLPDTIVDILHIDIQGAESSVIRANPDLLNSRVRTIFIGTHSRKIEGELLEFLHGQGWHLVRERPTKFSFQLDEPNVVGWTTRDGGQYWVNPRLQP